MTDPVPIPESPTVTVRRSLLDRFSIVWLVPFGALVIALGVAWQTWSDRGPLITITFSSASDISAGQTELQYRDVAVGVVERVGFTDDLALVEVSVRLDKEVAPYVDESASFWVVRPEVTSQGVSGLNTVLGGVYIEGTWDAEPNGMQSRFAGLDSPPLTRPDERGRRLVLRTDSGQGFTAGTPILYRGLEVGRIGTPLLASDGVSVIAQAFIAAPHDRLLTTQTRFWDISGVSFGLGPGGATVDFASLTSLVRGGVAFDTLVSGGDAPSDAFVFDVFESRDAALASLFAGTGGARVRVSVVFDDNLPGLAPGAAVTLGGLEVGEVENIAGRVDPALYGDDRLRLAATLALDLDQLARADGPATEAAVLDFLDRQVAGGLRARLANASLLTGGLKVDLVMLPEAAPAILDRGAAPFPQLPSAPAEVRDIGATAEGLLARVNALPVEQLLSAAIGFLDSATALVGNPDLQAIPGEARGLVADLRGVAGAPELQALPAQLAAVTADLGTILAQIEAEDTVARLALAVERAGLAAQQVGTAAESLPALVARIEAVAAKAEALDLETLLAEATGVVSEARALVGSEAAQALPDRLTLALDGVSAAADQANALLAEVAAADTAQRLVAALDAAAAAATDVSAGVAGLPELVTQLEAVAAKADALPLETLVAEASGVVAEARGLLATEAAQALPDTLTRALDGVAEAADEASALFTGLTEADGAAKLVAAVEAAGEAAADVSGAVEGIPALVSEIEAVAARVNTLELEELLAQVTALVQSADAVVGTEAAQALPAALTAALDEVTTVLGELRAGGTVENVNATLASARQAADSLAVSVEDLPALVARTAQVLAQAEAALGSLGESGQLNRDAREALREVTRAAEAVRSLARTIERQPSSLLTGR